MRTLRVCAFALLSVMAGSAAAQQSKPGPADYPNRPIRFVVPFTPAGTADIIARVIAQKMTDSLGQQVVVDNRGGSGGVIGSEIAAKSSPDGYTIMMGLTANIAINPALYPRLPYDPARDFAPVTQIAAAPYVLVVPPSLPAKSVKDLLALAKTKPGQFAYASFGNGSAGHLTGELFASMANVKLLHVPYKNIGQGLADLIAGQVQMLFLGIVSATPHVQAGKLRALATTGARRSPMMPDVPTVSEAGVKGYEVTGWYGAFVPTGTAPGIVARLHKEIVRAINLPDVEERLTRQGASLVGSTPREFEAYIRSEMAKWAKVVKMSGASVN
ncbi:MAG: tripartite tricarboxylate transporter substrate binding protein [Betaproteobacteria bacterium]|nr:tripartite tricarboxylate transporter substrate binding protein [Betaproteobacteria bacterium]